MSDALRARWEARLRREGLAPIDQMLGRRRVVRTKIISQRRQLVPDPARLGEALDGWAAGNRSAFTERGDAILRTSSRRLSFFAHNRARRLARICRALARGKNAHEAMRHPGDDDLAYKFLRRLAKCLAEAAPLGDDDET